MQESARTLRTHAGVVRRPATSQQALIVVCPFDSCLPPARECAPASSSQPLGKPSRCSGRIDPRAAVEERKARHAPLRLQAVLQVIDRRVRHHQRPANLQERRRLDDLHMAPKVAGIVAEVAVPASAGPRFDLHRERLAAGHLPFRTKLVQHGFEGDVDRRRNLDLLAESRKIQLTVVRLCPFS